MRLEPRASRHVGERRAQGIRQAEEVRQARVPFASFDPGDVRSVEVGLAGKLFLREPSLGPEVP